MFLRILKIIGVTLLVLAVLLVIAAFALNSSYVRNKLMKYAVSTLSEKLQTKVDIDSISVDVMGQNICLRGFDVQDRQQRELLQIEELSADISLWPLLKSDIEIGEAHIRGVKAHIVKPADSLANYQFLIDAFKKEKPKELATMREEQTEKKKVKFNLREITAEQVEVDYNGQVAKVGSIIFTQDGPITAEAENVCYEMKDKKKQKVTVEKVSYLDDGKKSAEAENICYEWQGKKKQKMTAEKASYLDDGKKSAEAENIRYEWQGKKNNLLTVRKVKARQDKKTSASINGIHYVTDNRLPRKNTGKPHRGAFDVGHFDIAADFNIRFDQFGKDTYNGHLSGHLNDKGSGLDVKKLESLFNVKTDGKVHLQNAVVELAQTKLKIPAADISLPSKKKGTPLTYKAPEITGTTVLRDISAPFAPVLKNFTLPLQLTTSMEGDKDGIRFGGVSVATADKKLTIAADGRVAHLKGKHKLTVHFDVSNMKATKGMPRKIVELFPLKKKFMMKQLDLLGDIGYKGSFDVVWKRQTFRGTLHSVGGDCKFDFSLDGKNKYVSGNMNTDQFALGKVLDLPDIGNTAVDADFEFDISKERTAEVRKVKGGKLPIGKVNGIVKEANYKKIQVRNLLVDIKTDGNTAEGSIQNNGKMADISCDFSFSDTEKLSDMKVRPHVKVHNPLDWFKKKKEPEEVKEEAVRKKEKKEAVKKKEKEEVKEEVKEDTEQPETKSKKKKKIFPIGNRKKSSTTTSSPSWPLWLSLLTSSVSNTTKNGGSSAVFYFFLLFLLEVHLKSLFLRKI